MRVLHVSHACVTKMVQSDPGIQLLDAGADDLGADGAVHHSPAPRHAPSGRRPRHLSLSILFYSILFLFSSLLFSSLSV
jgi:hypothetical protein